MEYIILLGRRDKTDINFNSSVNGRREIKHLSVLLIRSASTKTSGIRIPKITFLTVILIWMLVKTLVNKPSYQIPMSSDTRDGRASWMHVFVRAAENNLTKKCAWIWTAC